MKNIFLIDNFVGHEIAKWLIAAYPNDIACFCVTSPDSPIRLLAHEHGIDSCVYNELCELSHFKTGEFDFGFLIWWPYIVPKQVMEMAKFGFINTHPSYLPYNRGKHYNFWAIVEQVPFGVSLHFVEQTVDSGDIISRIPIDYTWEDTGATLFYKAQQKMIQLFIQEYPNIRKHQIKRIPQDIQKGSFHTSNELEKASHIELDKTYCARDLLNRLRARTFTPHPACFFEDKGRIYEVKIFITEKDMHPAKGFMKDCEREIHTQSENHTLQTASHAWFLEANAARYSYHFSWLGRPIIQYPQDIVAMQELIFTVQPDLIIETGIAHGGSLIFYASMLELNALCGGAQKGHVLGVDIDIRAHNRAAIEVHPMYQRGRITMFEGSSIAPEMIERVCAFAASYKRVMVVLDSNHTHEHVLAELNAYAPLVAQGSYCVVFDTVIEHMPEDAFPDRPWGKGNNPLTAVEAWLHEHPEFEADTMVDAKLLISVAKNGYLRRR